MASLPDILHEVRNFIDDKNRSVAINDDDKRLQQLTRESIEVLQKTLVDYTFDGIAISFNGGKDCLVLLVLYLVALSFTSSTLVDQPKLTCFVTPPTSFKEIDEFVNQSASLYHLEIERIALPMKEAFTAYLEQYPQIKAILVGTRRSDPHGEFLTHFDMTDHGWPKFMRVHPVVDWHYADIWRVRKNLIIFRIDSLIFSFFDYSRCHTATYMT